MHKLLAGALLMVLPWATHAAAHGLPGLKVRQVSAMCVASVARSCSHRVSLLAQENSQTRLLALEMLEDDGRYVQTDVLLYPSAGERLKIVPGCRRSRGKSEYPLLMAATVDAKGQVTTFQGWEVDTVSSKFSMVEATEIDCKGLDKKPASSRPATKAV